MPGRSSRAAVRPGVELRDLPQRLARAKRAGLQHVDEIVAQEAAPRRWPADVARRYLTEYLCFDIGPEQVRSIERFHALAHHHGVLGHAPWPLRIHDR